MPTLDRRIVVQRIFQTINEFGEAVEETIDFPMWAGVVDLSAFDVAQEGGTFTHRQRRWMVRWRADIAELETHELSVIDGALEYNVTNIVRQREGAERRRFMLIEGGIAIP